MLREIKNEPENTSNVKSIMLILQRNSFYFFVLKSYMWLREIMRTSLNFISWSQTIIRLPVAPLFLEKQDFLLVL